MTEQQVLNILAIIPIWTKWFSPTLYLYWFGFSKIFYCCMLSFQMSSIPGMFALSFLHSLNYPFLVYHVTSWVNTNILPWHRNSVWLYQKIFQAMFCLWMVQIFLCFSNFNKNIHHLEIMFIYWFWFSRSGVEFPTQ